MRLAGRRPSRCTATAPQPQPDSNSHGSDQPPAPTGWPAAPTISTPRSRRRPQPHLVHRAPERVQKRRVAKARRRLPDLRPRGGVHEGQGGSRWGARGRNGRAAATAALALAFRGPKPLQPPTPRRPHCLGSRRRRRCSVCRTTTSRRGPPRPSCGPRVPPRNPLVYPLARNPLKTFTFKCVRTFETSSRWVSMTSSARDRPPSFLKWCARSREKS